MLRALFAGLAMAFLVPPSMADDEAETLKRIEELKRKIEQTKPDPASGLEVHRVKIPYLACKAVEDLIPPKNTADSDVLTELFINRAIKENRCIVLKTNERIVVRHLSPINLYMMTKGGQKWYTLERVVTGKR